MIRPFFQNYHFQKCIVILVTLTAFPVIVGCRQQSFKYHVVLRHDWISKLKVNERKRLEIVSESKSFRDSSQDVVVVQNSKYELVGPKSEIANHEISYPISIRDDEGNIYSDNALNVGATFNIGEEVETFSKKVFLIVMRTK